MQFSKRIGMLLAAIGLASSTLAAQTSSGSISGVVQDETAAVIPGANVTVTNVDTGITRSVVTDSAGRYQVPGLIPGHYEVQAEVTGFQTELRRGIQLTVGSALVIQLVLQVGQVTEKTVVTAEAPIVETTTSALAGLVDDKTIRELPLNGRSFDQLISLESSAPSIRLKGANVANGMSDVFSVNGARTRQNLYLMDGTELVGSGVGSSMPGGVLGKNMGVDAVQEFKVLTGNYSAAYGKRAGGVINIATRSGTNQIHGSGFEFLRNDNLDARNFFDPTPQPAEFRRNQFGGAVGGPVRKDQTFYFGNYEGLREGLGLTNIAIVPDDNARRGLLPDSRNPGQFINVGVAPEVRPFWAVFPVANGRNFGDGTAEFFSAPTKVSSQDFVLTRLDHKFSDKDFLVGRYSFTRASAVSPGSNPYFAAFDQSRDQSLMLEEKRVYATTLNSLRFGFSRARALNDSRPTIPQDPSLVLLSGAKYIGTISFTAGAGASTLTQAGTGLSAERFYTLNQFEVSDQVFHARGPHSLQLGVQVQRIQHNENYGTNKRGAFEYLDLQGFLTGKPRLFRAPSPSGNGDATKAYRLTYFATFIQDDYKLGSFTLNLGLRYEFMTVPTEAHGRISNFRPQVVNGLRVLETVSHVGSPFFQGNHNLLAPRIGFAWDVFGNGKTAVRSGLGVFYDQIESEFRFLTASNSPFFGLQQVDNPPFPFGFSGSTGQASTPSVDGIEFNLNVPTRLQYSFSIQQQITPNTVFNIGYVGAHSYHLPRTSDGNYAIPQILPGGVKFYPPNAPLRNPALAGTRLVTFNADSYYNGLQMDVAQRLSHGLRFKVSFTYSKNIDNASSVDSPGASGNVNVSQDPENTKGERSLSAYDERRNLVMNFTYDLPWNHFAGVPGKLIGGWQLGAIATVSDGTPFTALTGFSRSRDRARNFADRPDLPLGANKNPVLGGPDRYFDPTTFVLAQPGFYGSLGRNTLIAPGFANVDLTLDKMTAVNERVKVNFRAEFFNLLNRANFGLPSNTLFNTNGTIRGVAGRVQATVSTSRQIQFGVKLTF